MRIAILFGGTHANYLEDILAFGLAHLFGPENVCCAPPKPHLRARRPDRYPHRACWSDVRGIVVSPEELLAMVGQGRVQGLIAGYPTSAERAGLCEDAITSARRAGVSVVVVNGEDEVDWATLRALEAPALVREMPLEGPAAGVEAEGLPLCYNTLDLRPAAAWDRRDIEVLWIGASHAGRAPYIEALEGVPGAFVETGCVDPGRYLDLLHRARRAVVLRGAGGQTYRYFEAAAAGAMILAQPHRTRFGLGEPDLPALLFETPQDLCRLATARREDDQAVAAEGRQRLIAHHTAEARARQVAGFMGLKP